MRIPTPLPASSPKLRDRRYQVDISRPSTKRAGSWIVYNTGRFTNLDDARSWAESTTPDGERFTVTLYQARDGWTAHRVNV